MEAKSRVMSGSKRSRSLRVLTILILSLVVLLLVAGVNIALAQAVDPPWKVTVLDCYGSEAQADSAEAPPCQSYDGDVYESLQYNNPPVKDADIQLFRLGWDDDYVYIEWDLLDPLDAGSEGHQYIVELDVDGDNDGDYDFWIFGKTIFSGTTWVDADGEAKAFFDEDDDAGGTDITSQYDTSPGSGGAWTGYESEIDLNDGDHPQVDVYARIISGNVQMVIRRDTIGSPANTDILDILARGTTSQSSSVEPVKLYWNDENPENELDTDERFDNTEWTYLPPTAVTLSSFGADSASDNIQTIVLLAALGLLSLAALTVVSLALRRLRA